MNLKDLANDTSITMGRMVPHEEIQFDFEILYYQMNGVK